MFTWGAEETPQTSETLGSKVVAFLSRCFLMATSRRLERHLRICETLSLGEKRFIAVVEYDRQKFLLAGTPQNISLLQCLDEGSRKTEQASRHEPIAK